MEYLSQVLINFFLYVLNLPLECEIYHLVISGNIAQIRHLLKYKKFLLECDLLVFLAGIFMVELETKIILTVTGSISHWRRYEDDTFAFVKKGCLEHVLAWLNSSNKNIQFIYELENQNKLSFQDILLIWRGTKIETTVYRKSTNNDIYLNWVSFAPVA